MKKYLTILPIILGFFITKIYITYVRFIDLNFYYIWLSSSTLSITLYSFIEKFIPNKNKILEQYEIEENIKCLNELKKIIFNTPKTNNEKEKIILRGSINEEQNIVNTK